MHPNSDLAFSDLDLSSRFQLRPRPGFLAEIQLSSDLDLRSRIEPNSDLDLRSRSDFEPNSDLAIPDLDLRSESATQLCVRPIQTWEHFYLLFPVVSLGSEVRDGRRI